MKTLLAMTTTASRRPSSHRLSVGWVPSEAIIPAVPGEFYAYPVDFTVQKPLYPLMKCRANKRRFLSEAKQLGREANLLFRFDTATPRVHSVKNAHDLGLLEADAGESWVKPIAMATEEFYELCARKDPKQLVEICMEACAHREVSVALEQGMVVAVMTDAGKYGLFLVTELTSGSVSVDACHVLTP